MGELLTEKAEEIIYNTLGVNSSKEFVDREYNNSSHYSRKEIDNYFIKQALSSALP